MPATMTRRAFLNAAAVLGGTAAAGVFTGPEPNAADVARFFDALRDACTHHFDIPIVDRAAVTFLCDRLANNGWQIDRTNPAAIQVAHPDDPDAWFTFVGGPR